MNQLSKPVVARDVDGVLRVLPITTYDILWRPTHHEPPENADEHTITIPEDDELHTRFHQLDAGTFTIYLARPARARILSLLERDIEVVWATTWIHHANRFIAPALGTHGRPHSRIRTRQRLLEARATVNRVSWQTIGVG